MLPSLFCHLGSCTFLHSPFTQTHTLQLLFFSRNQLRIPYIRHGPLLLCFSVHFLRTERFSFITAIQLLLVICTLLQYLYLGYVLQLIATGPMISFYSTFLPAQYRIQSRVRYCSQWSSFLRHLEFGTLPQPLSFMTVGCGGFCLFVF